MQIFSITIVTAWQVVESCRISTAQCGTQPVHPVRKEAPPLGAGLIDNSAQAGFEAPVR